MAIGCTSPVTSHMATAAAPLSHEPRSLPPKIMGLDGFQMAYQPLVDLQTGRVSHFEALLRPPRHPFGSVEGFVRAAERFGVIVPIDLDITSYVANIISAAHFATRPTVAVNLSGRSLDSCEFRNRLRRRAESWATAGSRIIFEVTETHRIRDLPSVCALLSSLRHLGFRIAIDDFGKNETDDSYLKSLVFDEVKLDGSIVRRAKTPAGRKALVRSISRLRPYNVTIVAEMIESPDQVRVLRDMRVDRGQGYLFQPPTTDPTILDCQDKVIWPL